MNSRHLGQQPIIIGRRVSLSFARKENFSLTKVENKNLN